VQGLLKEGAVEVVGRVLLVHLAEVERRLVVRDRIRADSAVRAVGGGSGVRRGGRVRGGSRVRSGTRSGLGGVRDTAVLGDDGDETSDESGGSTHYGGVNR